MTAKFSVDYDRYTYVTREGDPEDRWDRDDTAADITVNGVRLTDRYFDVVLPTTYDPSKPLFLLWANYNTGDSFGHDRNQTEWIDIFQDEQKANEAAATLAKCTDRNYSNYSGTYIRDDGTSCTVHLPWLGYFESLNDVIVTPVRLMA